MYKLTPSFPASSSDIKREDSTHSSLSHTFSITMSTTNNTTTCAKCGRVFAPAGQGNCTLKCCPRWTDHAGALERLETSIQQSGGKVTDAATATFVAAREDNLTKEVQRQSPEPKEPANGEGAAEMTTADVDRIIAEKQRVVDNALSEIADLECKVIELLGGG
jgi:hypothetical protein